MATTITKGLIGKEDLSILSGTPTTFSRATSSGGSQTMTKIGRHTFATREYDVRQYGAIGDGTTDDTAAIQTAISAAEASGSGGTVVFPPGYTFRVQPETVNTPIFALASGNLTFVGYGATIKVDMSSDKRPTTLANESNYAWVFKAINYDNLTFLGITFDGNRDDASYDPRYGFFMGAKVSNVKIHDCTFKNANTQLGHVYGTAWDVVSVTGEKITNWDVSGNYFEQSNAGVWITEAQANISITNNRFKNMNIAPYYSNLGPAWLDTFYGGSSYKTARVIRISGFGNTDASTHGEITDINVSNNTIDGGAWSIEFWNNTDDNPDKARRITIANNHVWGIHGISVTEFSDVVVSDNIVTRMTDAEVAAYAGKHYNNAGTDAAGMIVNTFGGGVEAGACYNISVTGNVLDGAFAEAGGGGTGAPTGISAGGTDGTHDVNFVIANNILKRWYTAIRPDQCQNSVISGNVISESRSGILGRLSLQTTRVNRSGFTWRNNVCRGNTIIADETAHGTGGSGGNPCELQGNWKIDGNTFLGPLGTNVSGLTLLTLGGFASVHGSAADISEMEVTNNTFRRFEGRAISHNVGKADGLIRLYLNNNVFDTEEASPSTTSGAIRVNRPAHDYTPVFKFGRNHAVRLTHPLLIESPAAWSSATTYAIGDKVYNVTSGTLYVALQAHLNSEPDSAFWATITDETYDFGEWTSDGSFTNLFKSAIGGGVLLGGLNAFGLGPRRKAVILRTNSGAATVDVASFFPAESLIVGVRGEVSSTITMGGGGTTWSLGCPFWMNGTQLAHTAALTNGNTDAWGTGLALTAGTDIEPSTWRTPAYSFTTGTAAATLRLTANTGTFTDGYVTLILDYVPLAEDII